MNKLLGKKSGVPEGSILNLLTALVKYTNLFFDVSEGLSNHTF